MNSKVTSVLALVFAVTVTEVLTLALRHPTTGLDGAQPKYLLMNVGEKYEIDRKPTWIVVYKNDDKKECIFKEVDSSMADSITASIDAHKKKQSKDGVKASTPKTIDGLQVIDDTNVSSLCDGYSTRNL